MIVYVETNFVIEIALEQEESLAANTIVTLAENSKITLAFPNFVFAESFESVKRNHRERNTLHDSLVKTLGALKRSEPHRQIMLDLDPVISVLKNSQIRELDLLHLTLDKLLNVGECINVDIASFRAARIFQNNFDLSPQDSIIYSAIIADMRDRPTEDVKLFLSRDKKAFNKDDDRKIKADLSQYKCSYFGSFQNALGFINRQLREGE